MKDVHVNLNSDLSWQKRDSKRKLFSPADWTQISGRNILERSFVLCQNLDTSENRSEILESFENRSWRRMLKLWTHNVKNGNVLHITKEEIDVLHTNHGKLTELDKSCVGTAF
jgi:hypothetical protein